MCQSWFEVDSIDFMHSVLESRADAGPELDVEGMVYGRVAKKRRRQAKKGAAPKAKQARRTLSQLCRRPRRPL